MNISIIVNCVDKMIDIGITSEEQITQNFMRQKYACCALISAINARIFLTGQGVTNDEFEKLAEIACCKNGSAIGITKIHPLLGLYTEKGVYFDFEWIKQNLPVELSIMDVKNYGFHSILVVGVKNNNLFLTNFDKIGIQLSWDEMQKYRLTSPNIHNLICRSFKRLIRK